MTSVLGEWQLACRDSDAPMESRSGASVHAVRTIGGHAAYLKATPATSGSQAIALARRELRFYQDLAPTTPVRTPRLLDCRDTEDGVATLLEAVGQSRPAQTWTPRMWANLGRELARLHNMPLPGDAHWNRPDPLIDPDLDRVNDFWAPTLPQLPDLLARVHELTEEISALPPVFTHGDCHVGNLLHSAGSLVFCDWQSARIGRPVSDLAFLSVRATPAGVTVPPELIDTYLDNRPCERRTLQRALVAEELGVFVFQWPPFAAFNSHQGVTRVRRRTAELAERWLNA
ncbi:aminoglycoside phosphotransferase family protein [Nonomuraea sp. NPDC046802]|uniref:aminoglycoside phosphotransferase family protein n=1 Tax=Nonomuraea sp. NPDC046802 TaxID=3154919 RepID=UPI00340DF8BB